MTKDRTGAVSTANALKMAIEAFEKASEYRELKHYEVEALYACKEALEQPAPNIDYDLYRNVDRPVNPEGHKK